MTWTIGMSDADISTQTLAYTVASGREARLTVEFTNRSTSAAATIQLWVVPSGESVGNEHLKESGTTLSFAGTRQAVLTRNVIAPDGAKVYVQASTANVSCQVSGDVVATDTSAASITDGTASIVYGSGWSNAGAQTSLKRSVGSLVTLHLSALLTGVSGASIITLPVGYAPTTTIDGISGILYDSSSGLYLPAYFLIIAGSIVSAFGMTPTGAVAISSGDTVFLSISYFAS